MKLHSSFWLDNKGINGLQQSRDLSVYELAKYKRSIAKFVKILTKKSIPVTFRQNGDSKTDGKKVIISSTIKENNFDSIVGLALHEGSHILLTDFNILPNLQSKIRTALIKRFDNGANDKWFDIINNNLSTFKSLLNIVEDRRIDYYVYTNSPGYKPYYEAMYDRYFRDRIIDKALLSDEYTDLTIESYMFRIINFLNENNRFDALPELEKIYNLIFENISTIESTEDSLDISIKIFMLIWNNIDKSSSDKKSKNGENENGDEGSDSTPERQSGHGDGSTVKTDEDGSDSVPESSDGSSSAGNDKESENNTMDDNSPDEDKSKDNKKENNTDNKNNKIESKDDNKPELTERQKKLLPKKANKQKKFLDGDVRKGSVTQKIADMVDSLASSSVEIKEIDQKYNYNSVTRDKILDSHAIIIRGWNMKALKLLSSIEWNINNEYSEYEKNVKSGIRLGKRLGNKLRIRNRERTTTYNRQKSGKLDKRRIHSLGTDSYNVFNKFTVEKHDDAFIHLSIDSSQSMDRNGRFNNAIESAVAIAKMADMTNIDVQISFRYGIQVGDNSVPAVWDAYDSRRDSFNIIKNKFKYIIPRGGTPGGLCFETIMDDLPSGRDTFKTYFINYSDGEPWFKKYNGQLAIEHTKNQVKKIIKKGYSIMSYFIGQKNYKNDFIEMYGEKNSEFVNPSELNNLVKTLQSMFVKR